ncbi:predicted protein [Verticillium alfalfae VaMs.102]|uniref:Predicted protein n=1 Tax=Verticillium alfalfae (strain VaMs.102 / ATCC MYA-4576 / FGSC 10136) TaxID=526221 RepID=C9SSA0_VERA1|nr:predicted protein [Verticillium alfalfae VaMs.102]EEY21665.1 predicted protein [Verticillium alfalfae VaMs.102]
MNNILGWTASVVGQTDEKKAVAIAMCNTMGNLASVYTPYLWPSKDEPRYLTAMLASIGFSFGVIICAWVMRVSLQHQNKKLRERDPGAINFAQGKEWVDEEGSEKSSVVSGLVGQAAPESRLEVAPRLAIRRVGPASMPFSHSLPFQPRHRPDHTASTDIVIGIKMMDEKRSRPYHDFSQLLTIRTRSETISFLAAENRIELDTKQISTWCVAATGSSEAINSSLLSQVPWSNRYEYTAFLLSMGRDAWYSVVKQSRCACPDLPLGLFHSCNGSLAGRIASNSSQRENREPEHRDGLLIDSEKGLVDGHRRVDEISDVVSRVSNAASRSAATMNPVEDGYIIARRDAQWPNDVQG